MLENKTAVPHTFTKDGIYYFVRRVPLELRQHYVSSRISYSLRTKSAPVAASRASRAAIRLDEYWYHLRCQDADLPGNHMLRFGGSEKPPALRDSQSVNIDCMLLSEAMLTYLRLKGHGKGITFHRAAERSCGYVIDVCGDKPLNCITKADANSFRDSLVQRGMAGSSITRTIGTVRSVFNFASSEAGLSIPNPFAKIYYDREAGVSDRKPLSVEEIKAVQKRCYELDDEARWLACCRFRGHEVKIVTMELESGYDETEVQPGVQDRGGEAGDRARCFGLSGLPGSGTGRERAASLDA